MKPVIIIVIIGVIVVIAVGLLMSPSEKSSDNFEVESTPEPEPESTPEPEPEQTPESTTQSYSFDDCTGTARCITGTVTKIIDGDTIHVNDESVRFALASAPELSGFGGEESRDFIDTICPVGSDVLVNEDDGQSAGSYGRIIGVVYCNGVNLNSELLDVGLGYMEERFCDSSEFAKESWAIKHGC